MSTTVTPESNSGSQATPATAPTTTTAAAPSDMPVPKPRKKRNWRRILLISALCVLALAVLGRVILVVALPRVLKKVAAAYDLDASYSRMELYLLGGDVGLWDLTVRPKDGGAPLLTTEYARGDISTLNLLRGKLVVRRAELDGARFDVERDAQGRIPALEKLLAGNSEPAGKSGTATALSLDPPLRVDALRVNRLRAHWVDRSVSPAIDTELEMTLRLSEVGLPDRSMRLLLEGTSPPLLDTLRVEGTADAQAQRLNADVSVLVRGLHPRPASGYLALMGIKPVGEQIGLRASMAIRLHGANAAGDAATPTTRPLELAGTVTINQVSAVADGNEAAGVDRIVIDADALSGNTVRLSKVTIDGVRASSSRTPEANLRFAGLELGLAPASTQPVRPVKADARASPIAPAALQTATPSPGKSAAVPMTVALGELSIRNVLAKFHDDAVTPSVDLAFVADELSVKGVDSRQQDTSAQIIGLFSAPGVARSIRLDGMVRPFAATRTFEGKVVAEGVKPDAIRRYLDAMGVESTIADATLTCDLRASAASAPDGTIHADARLANISFVDSAAGNLFAFDSAQIAGVSLDPAGSRVRVETIDLSGPRLGARRSADGSILVLGLRSKPSASANSTDRAPVLLLAQKAAPSQEPLRSSPVPRIEVGRFTWKGMDIQLQDEAVAPATNVRINDAGVELADVVLDLDPRAGTAASSPGKIRAWMTAKGIADGLNVEGTIAPTTGTVSADLNITGKGLRGDLLAPYLKPLGVEPVLHNGSLQMRTRIAFSQKENDSIAATVAVHKLRYADGEHELVGLDRLALDEVALSAHGLSIASVALDKPRARAQRNADGSFDIAGVRVNLPSTQPATQEPGSPLTSRATIAQKAPDAAPGAPFVATLGKLRINDGSLAWTDHAVNPPVDAVGHASIEGDRFVVGRDAAPATLKITAKLDKTLEMFAATGVVSPSATSPMVRLDITAVGLREGVLASYLPPGMRIGLNDGRFRATVEAAAAPLPQAGHSAKLVVSGVDYRDGEAAQPLLAFDSARVLVGRADIPGKVVAVDEIAMTGFRAGARKAADGSVHALGLKIDPLAPQSAPPPAPAAPAPPTAQSTQPSGSADVNALIASGREKLPLITLKSLAVQLSRVSWLDESQPGSAPIALADVVLRNRAPIELLGGDPQSCPPVDLELVGKVDPLVGSFVVAAQVSPFASQPALQVAINASGINGSGLSAVAPQLRDQIDGAALTDGRFSAALEASAKVTKRGPADFDFAKPMEVTAALRDVAFRADGSENSPVLAGVKEVRADGVRFDPATGSIIARSVEISRPIASAWRGNDGIHALGLLIKPPATKPTGGENPAEPTAPRGPQDTAIVASAADTGGRQSNVPARPQAEMTIEKLLVSGIDVNVEDRSVNPPLVVPLNTLEAEVRGLSNMAPYEARPIRFNVTAGAGKVLLAPDRPSREMFSEVAASGSVTLYPTMRGWARSSVSGLEMLALKGSAAASKVSIEGGVFDSRVDVRFQENGALDTRSRFAFTDLRMSEPEDGVIRSTLKLPGPLDAMIILLQDASGAITVPLNVTAKDYRVGGGQIAGQAVTALGSILATAMASAPLKVTGGVAELAGLDMFGKKKPTGPQSAGEVGFYAGAGDPSSESATITLQQLIARMQEDKTLEVTLRHELGKADIERASQRANPAPEAAAALGSYLRERKAELLAEREKLAPAVRAMVIADRAGGGMEAIARLRDLEAQLATTEDALDCVYELTRPGADRQAERRTRAASLEIAEARLNAMKGVIVAAGIPDAENRVRVVKPQFTIAAGDAGGKVSMIVTSKKKP